MAPDSLVIKQGHQEFLRSWYWRGKALRLRRNPSPIKNPVPIHVLHMLFRWPNAGTMGVRSSTDRTIPILVT
ncbi:MAG: hypothetical protein WCO52_06370, partial [bacterium]